MKFKVGDKVKTSYGVGEILFIGHTKPQYLRTTYLIGIKGFNGCSGLSAHDKIVKEKGYENQCKWFDEEELELVKKDQVNHPYHYTQGKREVIEEMRLMFGDEEVKSFCRLNAYKYMRRAKYKGNEEQDNKKAEWYLDYLDKMKV